jgi:hypothetical protein
MSLINHRAREIHVKIVYYGPGLGGKTTNVRVLHERLPSERRGRLMSIATEQERTLFFDFMPVALGAVNGFTTRIHLYTVPGQLYYRRSRRAVLQGVDGIVFVADSQPARERDNVESLEDMHGVLETLGFSAAQIGRLPRVIQYNKRDLPIALPIERLRSVVNPEGAPDFEAVARDGRGVTETLRAACKSVLARLSSEPTQSVKSTPKPPVTPPISGRVVEGASPLAPAAPPAGGSSASTLPAGRAPRRTPAPLRP